MSVQQPMGNRAPKGHNGTARDPIGSQIGSQPPAFTIPIKDGTLLARKANVEIQTSVPHYSYIVYDREGVVLYVGLAANPVRRLRDHRKAAPWWAEAHHVDCFRHRHRGIAARDEWRLIKELRPRHNIVGAWLATEEGQG